MDHTPIDDRLSELEAADPADAPDIAEAIAGELADELEVDDGDPPETSA